MGCRPSKQATSKVRAVEHKDDPSCLCSPRKIRKNQKCSSASNYSRTVSGGSKAQNLSSSHKARCSRSADVDFPAFSTTTAVYRTSASKTSKITLRLSCDGSTLEIEQCDYDLEKVRGEIESKPRPWSSAPNLTKMRDSKSRLFRESYLPIKHSTSGWSPSTSSANSGSRGGLIRVPIQINTPDESLSSAGNSRHHFSGASQNGNNSLRDKTNINHALFEPIFCAKTFGKSALTKSQTSTQFSSGDERRPLLLDILKDSKKTNVQGNVNKAVSPVSTETVLRDDTSTPTSLDHMIVQLESTLGVAHYGTHHSGPKSGQSNFLEVNHVMPCEDLSNKMTSRYLAQTCMCQQYTSGPSADVQQIPVNVISSFITCQGQTVVGVEHNRNYYPLIPSPDIFYFSDPTQATKSSDRPMTTESVYNARPSTASPYSANNAQMGVELEDTTRKDLRELNLFETVWTRLEPLDTANNNVLYAADGISTDSQVSQHFDSEALMNLGKKDSPVYTENSILTSPSTDLSSPSLFTSEYDFSCSSGQGHVFHLEEAHTGSGIRNETKLECANNCQDCNVCRSNNLREENMQGCSSVDNRSVTENVGSVIRHQDTGSGKPIGADSAQGTKLFSLLAAHNSCPNTRWSQTDEIDLSWNESGFRRSVGSQPLMEVSDKKHYIILPQKEQRGDERLVSQDRNVGPTFSHQVALGLLPSTQQKIMHEREIQERIPPAHSRSDGETGGHIYRDILQVCSSDCSECVIKWMETSSRRENESKCLNSDRNISQPMYFPGGFNEKIEVSQKIDGIDWGEEQTPNLTRGNDRNLTSPGSNAEWEGDGWSEVKVLNVFDKHEVDRSSEDAGYLLGLLFPDRNNLVSTHDSRFSLDLEYSDGAGLSCSSISDSSDKEVSPTCYSLLDESATFMNSGSEQRGIDSELQGTNVKPSQRNSFRKDISGQVRETCLIGPLAHAHANDVIPMAESRPLFVMVANSIKKTSNIIHRNGQVNKVDNEQENKTDIINLGGDILASDSASITRAPGNDVRINNDTHVNVCDGQRHTILDYSITGINSFSSLHTLSEDPEGTNKNSGVFSDPAEDLASQQLQQDFHSGQILIERLASGLWQPRNSSGRQQSGQIIDAQDSSRLNVAVLACARNSHHHVIYGQEEPLETLMSGQYLNTTTGTDRPKTREKTICCSAEDGLEHQTGSVDLGFGESDYTRSPVQGHYYDLVTRQGPETADESSFNILEDVNHFSFYSAGQIERLNYERTQEFHLSKHSTSKAVPYPCAAEEVSVCSTTNDFHQQESLNDAAECEITACSESQITETDLSGHSNSFFCKHSQQSLSVPEHAEEVVNRHGDSASWQNYHRQRVSAANSQNLTSPYIFSSPEVLWNSQNSETSSTSETTNSSACNLANNSPNFKPVEQPEYLYPEKALEQNATLECRSHSTVLNSKEAILRTCSPLSSEQNNWSARSPKLSHLATNATLPHGFTKSTDARCSLTLQLPGTYEGIEKKLLKDYSQELADESRLVPRNNVLSLVRYFEKVPYSRRETNH